VQILTLQTNQDPVFSVKFPVFGVKLKNKEFNENVFEHEPQNRETFDLITVGDLLQGLVMKTKPEVEATLGTVIRFNTYNILFRSVRSLFDCGALKDLTQAASPTKVHSLLIKPKKGSKLYRNCLTKTKLPKKPVNLNIFKKFCQLSRVAPEPDPAIKNFNLRWHVFGSSNKLREFIFKFSNNILGLNSRVSHFNRFINEACSFCTLNKVFPAPRETFAHLFFDCSESFTTLYAFEQKYLTLILTAGWPKVPLLEKLK
jgi:hypothetical protein